MIFGPTPMRRLYLAVPIEDEDKVFKKIGEMGTVQLIKEFQVRRPVKNEIIEISTRFERLIEKLDSLLSTEDTKKLPAVEAPQEEDLHRVEQFLTQAEIELNGLVSSLENFEKEIKELTATKERLTCLVHNGLKTDEIGDFRHIFVKAGFMKYSLTSRLSTYINGTSITSIALPGRKRESFVVVAGLNDDRSYADETLKLLNFEEITLPKDLNSDPKLAFDETEKKMQQDESEIGKIKEKTLVVKARAVLLAPYVAEAAQYEEARGLIIRTKVKSLIHGWIPFDKIDEFRTQVEELIPKESIYLKIEEPKPEDTVPVQFNNRGILKAFELFTSLQGVPNYFEINPTPIYTLLYVLMFGMMFGDIGSGIVLIVIGVIITRLRRGLFAFSRKASRQIAQIMISCGLLTVVFGFIYGVFFLVRTPLPNLLTPLTDFEEIIAIALVFGVAQIILSLILNIANMVRRKERVKVILSERGLVGLVFYGSAVVVGYAFIRKTSLDVFFQGDTAIFSSIALAALALILFSPLIESLLRRENTPISRKLLEGFGQGLESFIAFIANSVSYIRLAAFAIAHEAIGVAAIVLAGVFGTILSLVLLNTLDFTVEGFASFIQSLRLMYYEFSTRFFLKNGIPYKPFKIDQVRMKT